MQITWAVRRGHARVIVVFGGWGIGPDAASHLGADADILWVSDYRDLTTDLPDLADYAERILVAWSFGVCSAAYWLAQGRGDFTRCVAINGTCPPIDRMCGLPPVMMQKTTLNLNAASYAVFLQRCFGSVQPERTIDVEALHNQLVTIGARDYTGVAMVWDRVIISRGDRIFPAANQRRAWAGGPKPIEIDGPHVPFGQFRHWEEIVG
ncbi:hypothetical protein GCM10007939_20760 [Amylibacter marinus]|uniref:Biotin synthesis protein BioG n=1 Tax=Amylibacter marinus TaxID=1475483 RepID=A0ABQ5VWY7_9RHOB|nr:pimeloyl-ACP methyl esterase BioG family protein [Amylibacter marinus]GLQ35793.1 hypothetical protein GCM10007939_20760 [Amylibacter marinus]